VRSSAARALGGIKDARAVEPLIGALKDKEWPVRWSAASALGKIKDTRAVEPLIGALRDIDELVRCDAAWALGKIDEARAVEPLIGALKDKEWPVRYNAACALAEISDARANEALIDALRREDLAVVHGACAFFISRGVPGTETILIRALSEKRDIILIKEMTGAFLNSGNAKLVEAGRRYAEKQGWPVEEMRERSPNIKWGSGL